MTTTVAQPRARQFPGKGIGIAVIGLALAVAIGYGISTVGDETVQESAAGAATAQSADVAMLNSAGAVTGSQVDALADTLAQSATSQLTAQQWAQYMASNNNAAGPNPFATSPGVDGLASQLAGSASTFIPVEVWEDYLRGRMTADALEQFHFGQSGQIQDPRAQGPR